VVVIDSIDALNLNAANAILKILEEPPPQALLMLISHAPGRLLPTIRSRCRMLKLSPLTHAEYTKLMRKLLPQASEKDVALLGNICEYSPGVALELHQQGALEMLDSVQRIMDKLPNRPHDQIISLSEKVAASGTQHTNFSLFSTLLLHLVAQRAKSELSADWAEKWSEISQELELCQSRHLDYKSTVVNVMNAL
jgi:DNA polymerase-3 subunit delta'